MLIVTQESHAGRFPVVRKALLAGRGRGADGWVFSVAIGLSACLLFTLELMVGQMLLPLLGGAPSVWATTLGFFQLVLLLGYLYAHVSVTRLGRVGPLLHLALVVAAVAALVAGPRVGDLHFEGLHPILQVLATLTAAVGLPAFVLCATTPLLSAWLGGVLHARRPGVSDRTGDDPYRLYVVSNAGSLLALLAYPFVFEPVLGLSVQRSIWNICFVALAALLALTGLARLVAWGNATDPASASVGEGAPAPDDHLEMSRVIRWLFLAAVPCGLLSAQTNFIIADLISTPMLWMGPLAVYLATFVVAFSARGARPVAFATRLAPALITLLWIPYGYSATWPTLPLLVLELGGFAVVALTLHGRLAADRPAPARLTFFYLVVSAGGVVGGAFVGFLAPVVFPGIWEYPILLVAALLGAPAVGARLPADARQLAGTRRRLDFGPLVAGARRRLAPYAVIGVCCAGAVSIAQPTVLLVLVPFLFIGGVILTFGANPKLLASATALVIAALITLQPLPTVYAERDFFGVLTVRRSDAVTALWHGTTNHGSQWLDPSRSREPRAYYDRRGPLGDVMALAQARGGQNIGIIGLGAGSIAGYERATDQITFFEIDPAVIRAAEDPSLFTFLSQAPNKPQVVLGDGRLELRGIADATYDVLVLDAFSGDSIPTHLLTLEAFRDDLRVLKPGGLLVVHVSNRYYDLAPAVAAATRQLGLATVDRSWQPAPTELTDGALPCDWVVASRDAGELAGLNPADWKAIDTAAQPITDDFPDVLRFARFGSWLTGR
jgi:SAM-dependent methyltransferase